jgi:hypothetical protein
MTLAEILKHLVPFKIFIFIVLILIDLAIYYSALDCFHYATKKEDSPANLQASIFRGIVILVIALFITVGIVWLFLQKW